MASAGVEELTPADLDYYMGFSFMCCGLRTVRAPAARTGSAAGRGLVPDPYPCGASDGTVRAHVASAPRVEWGTVDETFDAAGAALCCAAAIRLGGAVRVLAAPVGLLDRFGLVVAGVENIVAFLEGQELDDGLLGPAFAESWGLEVRFPAELAGREFFRSWTSTVFVALVLTRPKQQDIVARQGLDFALRAAAAWPSNVRIGSFGSLVDFELACQQEAEDQFRNDGLPALWELAEVQSHQYRQAAERLVG